MSALKENGFYVAKFCQNIEIFFTFNLMWIKQMGFSTSHNSRDKFQFAFVQY
jgi:hypothetical protein